MRLKSQRLKAEILSEDGTHGKFVVEPLERGFGTTLGNSLRQCCCFHLYQVLQQHLLKLMVLFMSFLPYRVKEDVTEIVPEH